MVATLHHSTISPPMGNKKEGWLYPSSLYSMQSYLFCLSRSDDGMGFFITGSRFTIYQLFNVTLSKLKPTAFAQESRLIYRLNLASLHQVIKCLSANSKPSQNLLSCQQSLFTHSYLFSLIILFTRYTNYTTLTKHESMGIMWLDNNYNLDIDQEQKIKASNSLNIVTAALVSPTGYQSSDDTISTSCRLIAHCTQSGQNLQGVQNDKVYKRASRGGGKGITMSHFTPGQKVDWLFTGRGGYADFSYNVAAIVIKPTTKRVRIAIYNLRSKQVQYKSVTPDRLSARSLYVPEIDDASLEQQGGEA